MDFRGASADAVAALTEELTTAVSASPEAAAKAADTLFEVSQTLRAEAALRRFVTDASVPQEAKTGLVARAVRREGRRDGPRRVRVGGQAPLDARR